MKLKLSTIITALLLLACIGSSAQEAGTYWRADLPDFPPWPFNPDTNAPIEQIGPNEFIVGGFQLLAAMPPGPGEEITNTLPSSWWHKFIPTNAFAGWHAIAIKGNAIQSRTPQGYSAGYPGPGDTNTPWVPGTNRTWSITPDDWSMQYYGSPIHGAFNEEPWTDSYCVVLSDSYTVDLDISWPIHVFGYPSGQPVGEAVYFGINGQSNLFAFAHPLYMPGGLTEQYQVACWTLNAWPMWQMTIGFPCAYYPGTNDQWQLEPLNITTPPFEAPGGPIWRIGPSIPNRALFIMGLDNVSTGKTYQVEGKTTMNGSWSTLTNVLASQSMMGTNDYNRHTCYIELNVPLSNAWFFRLVSTNSP